MQFLDDFSNDAVVPADEGDTNCPSTEGSQNVQLNSIDNKVSIERFHIP